MIARHIIRFLGPAVVTASGVSAAVLAAPAVPSASAQPCPDVEVVFARGTGEPPGVGPTGQAFTDSLRPRVAGKSLEVYPVNYPASDEWNTGVDGIRDAGAHVVSMAGTCPQTKMVLGGYSQGAAVMGFVTSAAVPDGVDPATVPKPMDPAVADHVAAVVLFGLPNARAMDFLGQPPVAIGPLYQAKTIKVCAADDPVCSDGLNFAAHTAYADGGSMIDQGAAFAASHLQGTHGTMVGSPRQGFGS
jgi:cutinase